MTQTTLGHYVLGLAGFSLLRGWYSDDEQRDELRDRLLALASEADHELLSLPLSTPELAVEDGYTAWAGSYDGANPLVEAEEAATSAILASLEADGRVALDAGCGTGRKARRLADLGFTVIGCDATAAMLDVARVAVPEADFRQGRFEELPVDDASVDVVVSSLAVCHAPALEPVFAEFARVLRPNGRLVVSDPHPAMTLVGGQAFFESGGALPFVRNQGMPVSTYFAAAKGAGLRVDDLVETLMPPAAIEANPVHGLFPDVTEAAMRDLPYVLVLVATKSN